MVALVLGYCSPARLDSTYLPPGANGAGGGPGISPPFGGSGGKPPINGGGGRPGGKLLIFVLITVIGQYYPLII